MLFNILKSNMGLVCRGKIQISFLSALFPTSLLPPPPYMKIIVLNYPFKYKGQP